MVQRGGDEVDRHDVGVAEPRREQRDQVGQPRAELDRLEEVVGPVDLVHLAGLRVADHDRRPVHAPRDLALGARDLLGLELRAVVGMVERLALVEHRLGEEALVLAGGGDRRDVVQAARAQRVGELDGVARALHVRDTVALVVGGHVVDRREVEEMVDAARVLVDPRLLDTQAPLLEVPDDGLDAVRCAPALDQRVELGPRALAHEHVDVALALEQSLDQEAPDEPRRAGDEIGHAPPPRAGLYALAV